MIQEPTSSASDETPCSAGPLTAEMIREMEGHTPFDLLDDPPKRWQWRADYLNTSIQNPGVVCACCNVARDGEVMDHLPLPNAIGEARADNASPPQDQTL